MQKSDSFFGYHAFFGPLFKGWNLFRFFQHEEEPIKPEPVRLLSPEDKMRAKELLAQAKVWRGNKDFSQRNPEKALDLFEQAIALGSVEAKRELGITFFKGRGCLERDIAKGISLLTPLAEAGDVEAAFHLGQLYLQGEEKIQSNPEKARQYLSLVADANEGDVEDKRLACDILGTVYHGGTFGFEASSQKAKAYWEKAASLGSKEAPRALRLYFQVPELKPF